MFQIQVFILAEYWWNAVNLYLKMLEIMYIVLPNAR